MAQETKHFLNEADIGSGEKTPGQEDVERDQHTVGAAQSRSGRQRATSNSNPSGRILQSGNHLARIVAVPLPDGTYEAQVYVRLTREPEIAETYIPAGIFATESEAWTAAEERANRAFKEHEF